MSENNFQLKKVSSLQKIPLTNNLLQKNIINAYNCEDITASNSNLETNNIIFPSKSIKKKSDRLPTDFTDFIHEQISTSIEPIKTYQTKSKSVIKIKNNEVVSPTQNYKCRNHDLNNFTECNNKTHKMLMEKNYSLTNNYKESDIFGKKTNISTIKNLSKSTKFRDFILKNSVTDKKKLDSIKLDKEKKIIKIKLNQITKYNANLCQHFEKQNENFNLRLINYLNSDSYIMSKKLYHKNFRFSKNDIDSAHDLSKQIIETNDIKKNSLSPREIFDSFSKKEQKIISLEPKFFSRNNNINSSSENGIFEILNTIENKPLVKSINEEEQIEEMLKNGCSRKEIQNYQQKHDVLQEKLEDINKNVFTRKKNNNNNKFVNNSDLYDKKALRKLNNELCFERYGKRKNSMESLKEYTNKELKNCEQLIISYKNKKIINDNYNKTFGQNNNFDTKKKLLLKNTLRLDKEAIFQTERLKYMETKGGEEKFTNNYKNIICSMYENRKKNEKEKLHQKLLLY